MQTWNQVIYCLFSLSSSQGSKHFMQHKGPVDRVSGRAEARRGVMVFTQMDFNDTECEGKAASCGEKCLQTEQHLFTLQKILLWKMCVRF